MKRICSFLLAIIFSTLCASAAMADTRTFSIKDLPDVTTPRWKQTYEAYGRTIDVDVEIMIPKVETAPALKVQWAPALEDPLRSELAAEYEKADKEDSKHYYSFKSKKGHTLYLKHKWPLRGGTKKNKESWEKVTEDDSDLIRFDPDQAYAENNPMTVQEATEVVRTHLKEVFPDMEISLDTVWLSGATRWKRNKKTIDEKGYYHLNMRQCFHGIPLMASISAAYTDPFDQLWGEILDEKDAPYMYILVRRDDDHGLVRGSVYSEDSWNIVAHLYAETELLCQDMPLVSFDAVKSQVEDLINKGYVRWINSVTLGYAQFKTGNMDDFALVPSWVVWCEYIPAGPLAEKEYGVNDSELTFDGNNGFYRPLIINAQTGKLYNPESTEPGRIICPDLNAWQ